MLYLVLVRLERPSWEMVWLVEQLLTVEVRETGRAVCVVRAPALD